VSRYQKGNTNLAFTEARDSEWQWRQLGCMQVCTSLQTDNCASTPPYTEQDLRNGKVSIRLSLCPICLSHSTSTGLLLWAWQAGDIDRLLQQWQANAGNATLSAYIGS